MSFEIVVNPDSHQSSKLTWCIQSTGELNKTSTYMFEMLKQRTNNNKIAN
jgi:hypothetical protein